MGRVGILLNLVWGNNGLGLTVASTSIAMAVVMVMVRGVKSVGVRVYR